MGTESGDHRRIFACHLYRSKNGSLWLSSNSETMSVTIVVGLVTGMDRSELIQLLNLDLDWPMVTDIKGVHPPSLSVPHTLKIHTNDWPFLEVGTSSECYTGSVILLNGHFTVSMSCYHTDILTDSSVYVHYDQLWSLQDDDSLMCRTRRQWTKQHNFIVQSRQTWWRNDQS